VREAQIMYRHARSRLDLCQTVTPHLV